MCQCEIGEQQVEVLDHAADIGRVELLRLLQLAQHPTKSTTRSSASLPKSAYVVADANHLAPRAAGLSGESRGTTFAVRICLYRLLFDLSPRWPGERAG